MKSELLRTVVGFLVMFTPALGWGESPNGCDEKGPTSTWVTKSPYPFRAGSERTLDELYHGPWRARVDIVLYSKPRSQQVVEKITRGTIVKALVGESIVVHPIRLIAAKDFNVTQAASAGNPHLGRVRKGEAFWVLNTVNEGEFAIWWRCRQVGWDSTEPSDVEPNGLERLGTNEERWVRIQDNKTGLSGWFNDVPVNDGLKLEPAHA